MYKVPLKYKRSLSQELKKFLPLVHSLQARGKSSSEEDTRILLNDMLHSVLGYDKYNELKTEMRDKGGRIDYAVKLNEGPLKNKTDRIDFVIEAKASHVELSQHAIDQTLTYCLTLGTDYFIVTNVVRWQLFKVKRQGKQPDAVLLHDINITTTNDLEVLAEEFYLLTKVSYLNDDWSNVSRVVKATKVEDVVAILLSDKIIHSITKELSSFHNIKIADDTVREILENQVVKAEITDVNKKLLKKINEKKSKKMASSKELEVSGNDEISSTKESSQLLEREDKVA